MKKSMYNSSIKFFGVMVLFVLALVAHALAQGVIFADGPCAKDLNRCYAYFNFPACGVGFPRELSLFYLSLLFSFFFPIRSCRGVNWTLFHTALPRQVESRPLLEPIEGFLSCGLFFFPTFVFKKIQNLISLLG
jgi:hypothetical protein